MNLRDIGRSVGDAIVEGVGRAASKVQESRPVAADLLESDGEYLIVLDAPGAAVSDVQVRYKDGAVLVRIDRFRDYREGFEMRFPGRGLSLDGRVELPDDAIVRPDRSTAVLRENGTLEVRVPKRDATGNSVPAGDDATASASVDATTGSTREGSDEAETADATGADAADERGTDETDE